VNTEPEERWWRGAVIYQIYPRSFADSDGDGVGDLDGVTGRLDHLVDLGVDALWLTPINPSGGADGGYDVTDYTDVDPVYGDLAAFDRLVPRGAPTRPAGAGGHRAEPHVGPPPMVRGVPVLAVERAPRLVRVGRRP